MKSLAYVPGSDESANASLMTVQSVRSSGASTIQVNTVSGAPSYFYGTMGTPNTYIDPITGETITVISEATAVDFAGHVDAGNVEIIEIAPGYTDAGSQVGDIVVIRPVTEWANNLFNILSESHNDDGTLKANIVTTPKIADGNVTTPKLAAEAVTPPKVAPSTLIATVNSVSSGSVVTSYTIATDDGNFASGVWTAPYDCIIQVSAAISYNNQASTASGGRLDFEIQKNSASLQPFWGVGRASNSVDDITAAVSIPVQMASGDTIRINNLNIENAGTLLASRSRLGVTILSAV